MDHYVQLKYLNYNTLFSSQKALSDLYCLSTLYRPPVSIDHHLIRENQLLSFNTGYLIVSYLSPFTNI
jgi:hypothetical protein